MSEQRWYVRNDNQIDNTDAHPEFWGLYDRSQEHGRECVLSIEHFAWNDGTDSSDLPPLIAAALNAAEEPKPAALSAAMLGEEDRQHLRLLREGLDDYWVTFPEHQSAIAFLDRLLGSDYKGGE